MKAKMVLPTLIIGFIVLISNLPPLKYWLNYIIDEKHYRYSSYYGEFTIIDRSISNVKGVLLSFDEYKKTYQLKNQNLYRIFYKNPLAFWRWHSYFGNDPRYNLPYMNWNEIKKRRIKITENHQHF
jgi:hypothetical protein